MKKIILLTLVLVLCMATEVSKGDFVFGEPVNLGRTVNSSAHEGTPVMPADGLSLFFDANRSGGLGAFDVWVITRATIDDEWGTPVNLGAPVNTSSWDGVPSISADGLSLFISSNRSGSSGGMDMWISTRETIDAPWSTPANLGPTVNSAFDDVSQSISANGLELYFSSNRPGGSGAEDLWMTTRATTDDNWGTPVNLGGQVNTSYGEVNPSISPDGLSLFFFSTRSGGYGSRDIWMTTRATTDDEWGTPVNLGEPVNTSAMDQGAILSADSSTIFFCSSRSGGYGGLDLFQISIEPIFDLNSDLKVDLADMHILVDHWGENYSLCDIHPIPFGNGIVDIQDMIVLSEHLFEDSRLAAYWKLDETEGSIAFDSSGDHDGTLNGNPFWQPSEGKINGALLLDGIDNYVETPFILNPANGSLSVFAWIMCWTPGQVIISQTGEFGGIWLGTNPSEGKLMTGFSDLYFGTLDSESVITDIQWHHVGLVYDLDQLHRHLYVDGIEVAKDTTVVSGLSSDGSLYIGATKELEAGSFLSGMIDDVRIYDVALSAEEIAVLAQ
ncbi:MAG: hypothetical protein GY774_28930 [Planctomycetes bacterium]|nr:hypothetical protein [Planctomycetota bacterium]